MLEHGRQRGRQEDRETGNTSNLFLYEIFMGSTRKQAFSTKKKYRNQDIHLKVIREHALKKRLILKKVEKQVNCNL